MNGCYIAYMPINWQWRFNSLYEGDSSYNVNQVKVSNHILGIDLTSKMLWLVGTVQVPVFFFSLMFLSVNSCFVYFIYYRQISRTSSINFPGSMLFTFLVYFYIDWNSALVPGVWLNVSMVVFLSVLLHRFKFSISTWCLIKCFYCGFLMFLLWMKQKRSVSNMGHFNHEAKIKHYVCGQLWQNHVFLCMQHKVRQQGVYKSLHRDIIVHFGQFL